LFPIAYILLYLISILHCAFCCGELEDIAILFHFSLVGWRGGGMGDKSVFI